jgi:mannosyltransferase
MNRALLRRGLLLALILLAFGVRIAGLTAQSFWRDEVDALRFAQAPPFTLLTNLARPGWNGPLFYVVLRLWMGAAGENEFAVRYLSLLWGVLGVALLYRLGREWFDCRVGSLAALLLATSPYLVWYAQEAKMYAMVCALALALLYLYRRALEAGTWRRWIGVVLLTWLTAGTHVIGGLIVPLMAALLGVWWPTARRHWRAAAIGLATCVLPGVLVLPWALPMLVRGVDIGHRFTPLPGMVSTMLYAFGRGIVPADGLLPMGLFLFSLLAGSTLWPGTDLLAMLRRAAGRWGQPGENAAALPPWRGTLAAWTWIAVPLAGLYAITLRVPMFVDRYLIWIGPAFYLLVARGLDQVRRRWAILAGLCAAAVLLFNGWGIWEQSAHPLKSDFRAAASYVRQHRQPSDLIMFHISYVRYTFEYYYGDATPWADGIPTNEQTTPEMVDAAMRERIGEHTVVWLVLSEPEMWDARGMTVAWLNAHATPGMRADFSRVSVIQYILTPPKLRFGHKWVPEKVR